MDIRCSVLIAFWFVLIGQSVAKAEDVCRQMQDQLRSSQEKLETAKQNNALHQKEVDQIKSMMAPVEAAYHQNNCANKDELTWQKAQICVRYWDSLNDHRHKLDLAMADFSYWNRQWNSLDQDTDWIRYRLNQQCPGWSQQEQSASGGSACTGGYRRFPNMATDKENIPGGTRVKSPQACMALCNANADCLSVDYNPKYGSCFLSDKNRMTAAKMIAEPDYPYDYYEKCR